MARSTNTKLQKLIWSVRILFFCIGLIFAFHLLKLSIPYSFNLVRSTLTGVWLYIAVNIVILTVGATSIYNQQNLQALKDVANPSLVEKMAAANESTSALIAAVVEEEEAAVVEEEEAAASLIAGDAFKHYGSASLSHEDEEKPLPPPISAAIHTSLSDKKSFNSSARDNSTMEELHKPSITVTETTPVDKQSDEMRKGADIEATWKAITRKPQLRKSETWNASAPRVKAEVGPEHLKKWETFNKRSTGYSNGGRLVGNNYVRKPILGGREAWMSQDELNTRVESFINTFNEKLRLQRQESDQHYSDLLQFHHHHPAPSLAFN